MAEHAIRKFSAGGPTLYLLDISSFIFRAFFAIRSLSNRKGEPTNAVYGVASMLGRLFEEADPSHLAVTYDSKEPSFRKEIYADYKANRSAPPDDLVPQFARIDELVRVMGIPSFRQGGVEADDLIATLTHDWLKRHSDGHVVVVTGDKDLMQLVGPRVRVWDTMADKVFGPEEVKEKFGVPADRVRDYLALIGDSSDNVPGVPGVGPKTAAQLLGEFGDVPSVMRAAAAGQIKGKKGEAIAQSADAVELAVKLVSLKDDVKLDIPTGDRPFSFKFHIAPELVTFLQSMDFETLLKRWEARVGRASAAAAEVAAGAVEVAAKRSVPQDFRTVRTEGEFIDLLGKLEKAGQFAVDLETTSLDAREAQIVGFAFCHDPSHGVYVPVAHKNPDGPQLSREWVLEKLMPLLENPKYGKIGQNLKYDWEVLMTAGIRPQGIAADTMVAAYDVDPSGRHNMDALSKKYLDYTPMSFDEACGSGKDQVGFDEIPVDRATR
ncbi:MAG TPA: 5'-3' exonuclease H3TH domain-containing protein, partial [Bdellovibrionota bacterium]|nr:5'-3' exonuclease H3TH domain-containing protein [Bdellovibrionota bacterium]